LKFPNPPSPRRTSKLARSVFLAFLCIAAVLAARSFRSAGRPSEQPGAQALSPAAASPATEPHTAASSLPNAPASAAATASVQNPDSGSSPAATPIVSHDPQGYGTAFHATDRAPYAQFARWVELYETAGAAKREALVAEGGKLVQERNAALQKLIQTDPASALSLAVPMSDRVALPKTIADNLETRVEGIGRLSVMGTVPIPGQRSGGPSVVRSTIVDGKEYSVYVPPAKATSLTIPTARIQGIALNQQLAAASAAPAGEVFDGKAFGDPSLGSDATTQKPDPAWTHGAKHVLIIRVDYSDLSGGPLLAEDNSLITPASATNLFTKTNGICDFYSQGSYGATSLVISQSDVTPVYRMPQTALYYAQGNGTSPYSGTLQMDAESAATTGGYNLAQYDRIGVVTSFLTQLPGSKVTFGGISEIGGSDFLINGFFDFPTVTHELGHTYGVFHANWWDPEDGSVIGTETDMLYNFYNGAIGRVSQEYGDIYDVMGGDGDQGGGTVDIRNHFNPWFKSILGWLPNAAVKTVLTSGVYRVYRYDDPNVDLVNHTMALKVNRDILRNYWIGYRRQPFSGSTNINNGAYISFGYFVNRANDLIDCNNPGVNVVNAGLGVGQSLVDSDAGVTITTLAQGGTAPNEYLDIQITLMPRVGFEIPQVVYQVPAASTATVLVDRLGGSTGTTTVNYSTVDGTAIAGTHYTATSGTLTWGDGDTTTRTVTVPLLTYPASGGATDFTIQLSNIVNGVLINPSTIDVSLRPAGNFDAAYVSDRTGDQINSVAMTPDGKQLVGGRFQWFGAQNAGYYARLNADGTRDLTFNSLVGANGEVNVIASQPDGKVLVGGAFTNVNNAGTALPYLARLNSDGSTDTGFIPATLDGRVLALAVQPDGKIVVGGYFKHVNSQSCLGLCRLNPNGTLDFAFNDSTYFLYPSLPTYGTYTLLLDNYSNGGNGRIIAGGDFYQFPSGGPVTHCGMVRLLSTGTVDPSFNIGQGAHERGSGVIDEVTSLAMQANGKILVGGNFTAFAGSTQKYLARLNGDGSTDSSFSPAITGVNSGASQIGVASIIAQPDGKIVIGGTFLKVSGAVNSNLARINAAGGFDASWDDGVNNANGSYFPVTSLLLRPDGRIMVTSQINSYFIGTIRGAASPFDNLGGGIAIQALYSGILGQYGVAEFPSATAAVRPGQTLTVNVLRVGGNTGPVKVDYGTQDGSAIAGTDYITARGTLTWADGDSASKPITVTIPAGATSGRKFIMNLGIPNGGMQIATPASLIATINVNAPLGSPGDGGLGGTASGGSTTGADAAALMTYALGGSSSSSDATASGGDGSPQVSVVDNHLRLIFVRDPQKTDVTYEAQASDDLTSWETIARSTGGMPMVNFDAAAVSETPAGALIQVTVDDSVTLGSIFHRYLRLRISR